VDIITAGWSALQTVREETQDLGLAIHAHRAMHAAFDRNTKHGISMLVLSDIARAIGVDQLHIGTVIGKLVSPKNEVLDLKENLQSTKIKPKGKLLGQNWGKKKSTFPVTSGGLHPGHVPKLLEIFGNDVIIQVGGGISGHPMGVKAGARALRQAIDASMDNIPLKEYAKNHKELAKVIETWGSP